jgi:hypothetical protein
MKITRSERLYNLGGQGKMAHDVYFDNGEAVRIIDGMAYLFRPEGEELDDAYILQIFKESEGHVTSRGRKDGGR